MEDYEKVFEDFWKEIVCNDAGKLNIDQVKRELFDYWVAMEEVPKVYDAVTGGKFSKLNTAHQHVIEAADERYGQIHAET